MRKRNALYAEVRIDNQVAREDLSGHDLTYLGVDDLLPGVCSVRHHEAKVKAVLLNDLVLH